jgi:hypothetical protein
MEMLGWSLLPPSIENVALFLVMGSASALLFSFAKSGFGGSIGILAVPVMVLACGRQTGLALGLLLPMLLAADYVAVAMWWRQWDARVVLRLVPGAVVGIGASWAALWLLRRWDARVSEQLTDQVLKLGIGAITLFFVGLQVAGAMRGRRFEVRLTWPTIFAAGAAAGVTSTIAHAAGPIVAMYALALGLSKERYVASIALVFWVLNHLKLPAYFHLNMINTDALGATVLLLPAITAGAVAGLLLHRRLDERRFAGVVYALLALAGGGLIYQAIAAMV